MLIEIGDKIISTEIFEKKFVCDLTACKGACCVEGDSGAPLTFEEIDILEDDLENIKPFMRPEGILEIEKNGVFYMDSSNQPVTTLVNGKECAFVFFDENGITKCSIEKAHQEGKTEFLKPISCHLYPIRTKTINEYEALNYEEWKICEPACACGESLNVPVFRFLKTPLIRAYGENFFKELELVDKEMYNNDLQPD